MSDREKYIELLRLVLNFDTCYHVLSYVDRIAIHREISKNMDFFKQGDLPAQVIEISQSIENFTKRESIYKEDPKTSLIYEQHL